MPALYGVLELPFQDVHEEVPEEIVTALPFDSAFYTLLGTLPCTSGPQDRGEEHDVVADDEQLGARPDVVLEPPFQDVHEEVPDGVVTALPFDFALTGA